MPRFFSIFSSLLRLFPITLSPPPLFPFSPLSSSSPLPFFHPSISAPSSQGSDLSWDGSKVSRDFLIKRKHGWKGLIYIPREQGQRLRRRHGFPWFSPNKYDEVSRMLLTASNCFSLEHGGKLLPGFEIMASLYEIGRNAYVLSRLGGWRR